MKNLKRILALIAVILLVGLYIVTLVVAVFGGEGTQQLFMACIVATVVIPCLMYIINWIYGLIGKQAKEDMQRREEEIAAVSGRKEETDAGQKEDDDTVY